MITNPNQPNLYHISYIAMQMITTN